MDEALILIVDDEPAICDMLTLALETAGFRCLQAGNAQQALSLLVDQRPQLVLLDWMLPGMSGIELARRMKRDDRLQDIPVIMLTARSEEDSKVQGLESGADDYITKPFSPRELISRIRAVLRRTQTLSDKRVLEANGLLLDPASHRVSTADHIIDMGPTEYNLLAFFMTHPDRAYTRPQLLDQVWGGNVYVEDRTIDVHIRRLRKALEASGHDTLIQTVRGTGYRFSSLIPGNDKT